MFSAAIHHERLRGSHERILWPASAYASQLATRKQIDPSASGVHTIRRCCCAVRFCRKAANVVTLKNTVPTSCTAAAHQSTRPGSIPSSNRFGATGSGTPIVCGACVTSMYCNRAADVKKSDPMKNVAVSAVRPTHDAYAGMGPTAKHADPTMNSAAIHHPRARGAHHVDPEIGAPPRLRWARELQRTSEPSGRRNVCCVTKPKTR